MGICGQREYYIMIPLRAFKIRFPQPPIKHTHKQRAQFSDSTHTTRGGGGHLTPLSFLYVLFGGGLGGKWTALQGVRPPPCDCCVNLFRQIYAVFCFLSTRCLLFAPTIYTPFRCCRWKMRSPPLHSERASAVYYFKFNELLPAQHTHTTAFSAAENWWILCVRALWMNLIKCRECKITPASINFNSMKWKEGRIF